MGDQLAVGRTVARGDKFSEEMFADRNDRWLTPLPLIRARGERTRRTYGLAARKEGGVMTAAEFVWGDPANGADVAEAAVVYLHQEPEHGCAWGLRPSECAACESDRGEE